MIRDEVFSLCTCWQIKLVSGEILGFTDSDIDLNLDGIFYHAKSGFSRSAIESCTSLAIDNLETQGIIDHDLIKSEDLLSGRFDNAEIVIFQTDHTGTQFNLRVGCLGEIAVEDGKFSAEIKGLTQAFSQNIGELYSPKCRAQLGDERCKFDFNFGRHNGKITKVLGPDIMMCSMLKKVDDYYKYGKFVLTSGENQGFETEVLAHTSAQLTLATVPINPIKPGDTFTVYAGCAKDFSTCCNKFQNAINFQGEPFIPNIGRFLF